MFAAATLLPHKSVGTGAPEYCLATAAWALLLPRPPAAKAAQPCTSPASAPAQPQPQPSLRACRAGGPIRLGSKHGLSSLDLAPLLLICPAGAPPAGQSRAAGRREWLGWLTGRVAQGRQPPRHQAEWCICPHLLLAVVHNVLDRLLAHGTARIPSCAAPLAQALQAAAQSSVSAGRQAAAAAAAASAARRQASTRGVWLLALLQPRMDPHALLTSIRGRRDTQRLAQVAQVGANIWCTCAPALLRCWPPCCFKQWQCASTVGPRID